MESLATESRIQRGDPLIIYFAGHGSLSVTVSGEAMVLSDAVVSLCSVDTGEQDPRGSTAFVSGVSKFEISALMESLAKAKGNNIVSGTFISSARPTVLLNILSITDHDIGLLLFCRHLL